MTPARQIVPGQVVFVTIQCVGGSFRFLPTDQVRQSIEFIFWWMVDVHGLQVHEYEVLRNHLHLLATDAKGNLPDFVRDFNSLVSRQLNAMRGITGSNIEKGYRLQTPTDEAKVIEHSSYTLLNACEANLVEETRQWTGPNSLALEYGQRVEVERPDFGLWSAKNETKRKRKYRSRGRAKYQGRSKAPLRASGQLVRPKVRADLSDADLRALIRVQVAERERELAQERKKSGKPVLGMEKVLEQHYLDTPERSRVLFENNPRVSGRDRNKRVAKLKSVLRFEREHRAASDAFRKGDRDVEFPYGTWLMAKRFNVRCATAPP